MLSVSGPSRTLIPEKETHDIFFFFLQVRQQSARIKQRFILRDTSCKANADFLSF